MRNISEERPLFDINNNEKKNSGERSLTKCHEIIFVGKRKVSEWLPSRGGATVSQLVSFFFCSFAEFNCAQRWSDVGQTEPNFLHRERQKN